MCTWRIIQWNVSNLDTLETEESVLISAGTNRVFGMAKSVLVIEVSSFQGVLIREVPLYTPTLPGSSQTSL